jgi:hypothetical protein
MSFRTLRFERSLSARFQHSGLCGTRPRGPYAPGYHNRPAKTTPYRGLFLLIRRWDARPEMVRKTGFEPALYSF